MPSKLELRAMSIWAILFGYGLEELRKAYEAAREAADRDRAQVERQWEELEHEVAAGRANFIEEDEEGRLIYDRGEHAGEMMAEVEGVLRIVREAFTISLHHFWERELAAKLQLSGGKGYSETAAFSYLKTKGINPREAALTALRLAANVAKHGEGKSAEELYRLRPDFFDTKEMAARDDSPGYEYLRITDKILDEFFDAIRSSGPQRKKKQA